jgi:intein/homing endonuclease
MIDKQAVLDASVVLWILDSNFVTEKGHKVEFIDHRFLIDYLNDDHPHKVSIKAAQAGMTFAEFLDDIHLTGKRGFEVAHTFHTSNILKSVVIPKLNPLINNNPGIKAMQAITDSESLKGFGSSFLHIKGANSESEAISFSADVLKIDEKDRSNLSVVEMYESRLKASKVRWLREFSNPSSLGIGVDASWRKSDMRHWMVKCSWCNYEYYIDFEPDGRCHYVDRERGIYACAKCGHELTRADRIRGRWLARFPQRDQIHGYWISQLMCFPAGTRISTLAGTKAIESLSQGDRVVTHRGKDAIIKQVMKRQYEGIFREITSYAGKVTATADHPFYALKQASFQRFGNASRLEFLEASNLSVGDWLACPRPVFPTYKKTIEVLGHEHPVDDKLARFMGLFVAEGTGGYQRLTGSHMGEFRGEISITLHRDEVDLINLCDEVMARFGLKLEHRLFERNKGISLRCNSVAFAKQLREWLGFKSQNKCVPTFVFNWPDEQKKEFLLGYFLGDSHIDSKLGIVCSTVSKRLMEQVQLLMASFGYWSNIKSVDGKGSYPNGKRQYQLHYIGMQRLYLANDFPTLGIKPALKDKMYQRFVFDGDYFYFPITAIREFTDTQTVHNIQVEGDESYIANNVAVHNCPWITAQDIINDYESKSIEYFHNFVLGRAYTPSDLIVNREVILRACVPSVIPRIGVAMGVDQKASEMQWVAGTAKGIFAYGRVKSWEEIEKLKITWDATVVADGRPYMTGPKQLAEKYKDFHVALGKPIDTIDTLIWKGSTVYYDRVKLMDIVAKEISDAKLLFRMRPSELEEYIADWANIYRTTTEEPDGRIKSDWIKIENKESDFSFATAYFRIALSRLLGSGSMDMIEPEGESTATITDEVRDEGTLTTITKAVQETMEQFD